MEATRRNCNRIPVNLDAELVYGNTTCYAFIENISKFGIYVKITCIESTLNDKPDAMVNVKFKIPSGQVLNILCEERWSKKNIETSLIEQVGMKIIDAPQEYMNFYQSVSLDH